MFLKDRFFAALKYLLEHICLYVCVVVVVWGGEGGTRLSNNIFISIQWQAYTFISLFTLDVAT
jgi:hypothetical protein